MTQLSNITMALVPEAGGYVAPVKILVMFVLTLPWLWASTWVDKDCTLTRLPRPLWMGLLMGGGVGGVLLWLLLPVYVLGLGVYVVLVSATVAVYVMQRNARVAPEARVLTAQHLSTVFKSRGSSAVELKSRIKVYDSSGRPASVSEEGTVEERLAYNQAQDLLYDIVWRRASEADVRSSTAGAKAARYIVDGVVVRSEPLEPNDAARVINFVKSLAGMDVAERRRPQKGKIAVDLAGQPVDIEVIAAGSTTGQRMQFKVVQESVRTRLSELGLFPDMLERLQRINALEKGLILVTAQAGNGLTSSLYSLLRDNDAYIKQLVTVEKNAEADLENVTQRKYADAKEMPEVLTSVLRRDPDVILVDQCTDQAGAGAILAGAADKKILLGMRARDAFSALAKWVKVTGNAAEAVAPLQVVICQVLVRKLCPACREAYRPNLALLRKANLPTDKAETFYRPPTKPLTDEKDRPIVCPTCQGIAYMGRTAVFELLEIDDAVRKLVAGKANLTQIKAAARKNKMLYLQEQAMRLVMEGVTSVQEIIRVSRPDKGDRR